MLNSHCNPIVKLTRMTKQEPVDTDSMLAHSYRVAFESSPVPHLMLAPDSPVFTILAVNDAYLKATNKSRENIIGKGLFEVFPSKDSGNLIKPEDKLLTSLNNLLIEKSIQQLNYNEYDVEAALNESQGRYWNVSNIPVLNKSNEVESIIHVVTDVTAEVLNQQNQHVQRSNDLVQQQVVYDLFRQAPVAISILEGPEFVVEMANTEMCKLWGKTPEQVNGKPIFKAMPELSGQGFEELMTQVRETGLPYIGIEMPTMLERSGVKETLYFNFIYQPLRERNGEFDKIMVISTEVQEQTSARTDLQKSREQLNLALEFGNIGVWQYEFSTQVTSYSDTALKLVGQTTRQDWNREKFLQLVLDEDKSRVIESMARASRTGILSVDFRIQKNIDSVAWISMQGRTMFDGKNIPVRMLGLISDITERKDDEIRKDEFMGIVSHELKTPVTSLKAYGQILHAKFLEEGDTVSAGMLAKIDLQVNKLTSLIGDLLDATRIEGGQLRFHEADFDSNEMVKDCIEEVQRTTTRHKMIGQFAEPVKLFGDRERIGQVLINFLTNAIKYSPAGSNILVRTEVDKEQFICSVTDTGLGIPKENMGKIFDRYYRVDGGKRQTYPGLGLGLFISAEIIKRQDGNIWVESEEGKGSSFYFSIPVNRLNN